MILKYITFHGKPAVMACDGKCHKAWGINKRPRRYFMEPGTPPRDLREGEKPRDPDDDVYKRDSELGDAPEDPGTYEGGYGKPQLRVMTDSTLMNKWCARECERSTVTRGDGPITVPDLENPEPNIPQSGKLVLRRPDGAYLTDDFETWSSDVERAHVFFRGAALNACIEQWRGHYDVRVVTVESRL